MLDLEISSLTPGVAYLFSLCSVAPMISVVRQLLVEPVKMRRAFFYWTVRDSSSFEWFSKLMDELYDLDGKHVLEVRHFLTNSKQEDDRVMGAVVFHSTANTMHGDSSLEMVLGHRKRHPAQVGRPNWEAELKNVVQITKEMGEHDCGVFLCGPEVMAAAVAETCTRLSLQEPNFHLYFAKETF
jgi:ferredoxin-NADP reductase